jgi:hypothetical protein
LQRFHFLLGFTVVAGKARARVMNSRRACPEKYKGAKRRALRDAAPKIRTAITARRGEADPAPGRITFHDPIPTAGCTMDNRDEIIERTRQAILSALTPAEWPKTGNDKLGMMAGEPPSH